VHDVQHLLDEHFGRQESYFTLFACRPTRSTFAIQGGICVIMESESGELVFVVVVGLRAADCLHLLVLLGVKMAADGAFA
jgi:hypothetical protein